MVKSLRTRLQLWHALIMLTVVTGLGLFVYRQVDRGLMRLVDTELEGLGFRLATMLESVPAERFAAGDFDWPTLVTERRLLPPADAPPDARPRRQPPRPRADAPPPLYLAVWDQQGRPVQSVGAPPPPWSQVPPRAGLGTSLIRSRANFREVFVAGPHGSTILVGRPLDRELGELAIWQGVLVAAGAVAVAVGTLGGAYLVRRSLRPLGDMIATAERISAGSWSSRIQEAPLDVELAALARTLNETFARLEQQFARQTRFTADASHELRTPLTIVLGHLELTCRQPELSADSRQALEACLRAARRMRTLIEQLLFLARADAGKVAPTRQPLDLAGTIEECVELLAPLAEQHQVQIKTELPPTELLGDPALLAQVAINLITNAIVHNRPGGVARIWLEADAARVCLHVGNTGPGIPVEMRARLFERFFRVDAARGRDAGGAGLGLAITRSIVELHGGSIQSIDRPELAEGDSLDRDASAAGSNGASALRTEFVVCFPRESAAVTAT